MSIEKFGLKKRPYVPCEGNGALLVVVNSKGSYWDYAITYETVIVALQHCGFPYQIVDLHTQRLDKESLLSSAAIVLAQCRLSQFLTEKEMHWIVEAVQKGVGLVNFDNDIRGYPKAYLDLFGFDRINPHPYASNVLRIKNNTHYISRLQNEGEYHDFDVPVSAVAVEKWDHSTVALAECMLGKEQLIHIRHITPWSAFEPKNYPVLFATRKGKGKAVQFTLNPRVWRNVCYGHARGMDDLFWRSIVWASKKPFAATMMPPFVTMSFDDCSGRYAFGYADIAAQQGYVPLVSMLLHHVPESLYAKIRADRQKGTVEYNTHALDYYRHMYHKFGERPYTNIELDDIFQYEDAWWHRVGIDPIQTVRIHLGEMGVNALPYLKKRGRVYLNPALQAGLLKADMCMSDGFYPYHLQNLYYDYLPDDHDFYAHMSTMKRTQEDFLTGCTVNLRESEHNDVEKAAANLAVHIAHGLRAAFYAEAITHEQKFESLPLEQWETILQKAAQKLDRYEMIHKGHDEISRMVKSKDDSRIVKAVVKNNELELELEGCLTSDLMLSVFDDDKEDVVRTYRKIDQFEGRCKV